MKNKINVNISPNPLDLQTLHCSQNDTSERKFYFTLHNNGEVIDTTDISDPIFEPFDVYKGGTEQLLPVNTDDPSTSPIIADIQYHDEEKTEQEFTYRESPTTIDGKALIEKIKGNTITWNQLVQNGNFADTSNWVAQYGSISASNNVLTYTLTSTSTTTQGNRVQQSLNTYTNHKYFVMCGMLMPRAKNNVYLYFGTTSIILGSLSANTWANFAKIFNQTSDGAIIRFGFGCYPDEGWTVGETIQLRNVVLFDLTAMFGSTKADEIYAMEQSQSGSGVAYFRSLYSLPYYQFDSGSLLSFNGTGIKTVGKNLFDFSQFANGTITFENGVLTGTAGQFYTAYRDAVNKGIELKYPKNTQITISFDMRTEQNQASTGGGLYFVASENGATVQLAGSLNNTTEIQHKTVTIPSNRHIDKLGWTYGSNPSNIWYITNFQVEFDTETEYEPYTSSTLSLPISTYFSNGMKSAGSVYDELTESKAITRIGAVDLGTLNWSQRVIGTTPIGMQTNGLSATIKNPSTNNDIANIISTAGTASSWTIAMGSDSSSGLMAVSGGYLFIATTETNPTAFKSAMSGVYLYYELATPTETPITTASLITENAEIPLSNEDGVLIGKCTEQLSENPGFIDAKIKLSDADGECYSNKIQLHVERKPS